MNLLLLIYAMLAGLTGFNTGPSAVAQMAAVAETGSLVPATDIAGQASIAAKALTARAALPVMAPATPAVDARRVAAAVTDKVVVTGLRAAPERRLE